MGQSLGTDLIPLKTCTWNYVYCQLGRTVPLVNERVDYFLPQEILDQAKETLATHEPSEIDWVTFVGSGEPTLHASITWLRGTPLEGAETRNDLEDIIDAVEAAEKESS